MKEIFSNLWNGSAASVAGALTAGLTYVMAAEVELPKEVVILVGAVAAVLGFMAGPQKSEK